MFRIFIAALFLIAASASTSAEDRFFTRMPNGTWFAYTTEQLEKYAEADRAYCLEYMKAVLAEPSISFDPESCLGNVALGLEVGDGPVLKLTGETISYDRRVPNLRTRLSVPYSGDEADTSFGEYVSDALKLYQWAHGLPQTSALDATTVAVLDRNVCQSALDWDPLLEWAPPAGQNGLQ